jgi:hypothetical protein
LRIAAPQQKRPNAPAKRSDSVRAQRSVFNDAFPRLAANNRSLLYQSTRFRAPLGSSGYGPNPIRTFRH